MQFSGGREKERWEWRERFGGFLLFDTIFVHESESFLWVYILSLVLSGRLGMRGPIFVYRGKNYGNII